MSGSMYPSRYKDQPAVTLESEVLAAQFLPTIGAKLCSLVHRPTGKELLVQRPNAAYRVAPFDGGYVSDGECSGCDEMFPSIDACFYELPPWRGTPIPDHGEVWALPWACDEHDGKLHLATYGVRFPYRLEKWAWFEAPDRLRTGYRLSNLSPFDLAFMWASHMMLTLEEGARLVLPEGVRRIVTTLDFDGSLGRYGDEFEWPLAMVAPGKTRDLRLIQPKASRNTAKYFIKGRMPAGWVELTYPKSGFALRLEWPVDRVPYLAVLPNEGGWQDLYNIFLEPATASFDRLDVARVRGECSTVAGGACYEWFLDIVLQDLQQPAIGR